MHDLCNPSPGDGRGFLSGVEVEKLIVLINMRLEGAFNNLLKFPNEKKRNSV